MPAFSFNQQAVLDELRHYLPTQTPLKDFIHHNSLHAFQHLKFYDAIFRASRIFGYQATLPLADFRKMYETGRIREDILLKVIAAKKGNEFVSEWKIKMVSQPYSETFEPRIGRLRAEWKKHFRFDMDNSVQPLLFRVLCSYLDQGISLWQFPLNSNGFLASVKELEKNSHSSFFRSSFARGLLMSDKCTIKELLRSLVGDEKYFTQYLFDQQFSHRGWSGMVATLEAKPDSLLSPRKISLEDVIIFELLLEIDALESSLNTHWSPLSIVVERAPLDIFVDTRKFELMEILSLWQDAFEWSYYDEALAGLLSNNERLNGTVTNKSFQAIFCIDERECSLRRHIEAVDRNCETLGSPGFFGVEFYFQPINGKFYEKLCPAPVTPKYLIKELNAAVNRKHETLYTKKSVQVFTGFFIALTLGFWSGLRMFRNLFRPRMSPAISNAFGHMQKDSALTFENKNISDRENNLQIGFTIEEMAARVEGLLRGIGLVKDFAPLVYVVAHGSSSANNPHHGAHDCGACSGRPGSVNSRVFALMANHEKVRGILSQKGIIIPDETKFIAALHDTAADEMEYYDTHTLNNSQLQQHEKIVRQFDAALDLNAQERSRRFSSIDTNAPLKKIRRAIKERSVSLFEPRPELGHGTNTLCIVGKRSLTKGLFLDRRAFLNSYDYSTDLQGNYLVNVMRPLGPVCGGINLEYYFSRVDNHKMGAGTKLPHNVMGLFGVANSSDGDLRPGLPWQMIEVHDPVRLLIVVQHFPEVVLKTIQSAPEMYEWFINEWVHLAAFDPRDNSLHYFKEGAFIPYHPAANQIKTVETIYDLISAAKEMETNHIVDATKENLPVYQYN